MADVISIGVVWALILSVNHRGRWPLRELRTYEERAREHEHGDPHGTRVFRGAPHRTD